MTELLLPDSKGRRLVFYLAMEEWACEHFPGSFFIWQVPPTVIFGRNQDIAAEVNLRYCDEHNIEYYRRKSGGGCVYSDMGNIMLSYIEPSKNAPQVFASYLSKLCGALQNLGIDAVSSEHNDVLVAGSKVSGNACFCTGKASIVHGTLLYDVDFSVLEKAITPSKEKLEKHKVKSVRQRVLNLKDAGLAMDIEDLKNSLREYFTDSKHLLSERDIEEIEEIEKGYLEPSFLFGKDFGKN